MAYTEKLPIQASALLVIDVQDSFRLDDARWPARNNPAFQDNVTRLIQGYRAAELPVIYLIHHDEDALFRPGSEYVRLQPFLAPRADEPVIAKTTRNAFTSTGLAEMLSRRGVRRLVVTGIQTEQCCETTTRVAGDLGYDVDFVTDATLTFPIADPATGDVQSTEAITRATEFSLRGRFARITPTDAVVAEVQAAAAACSR